MMVKVGQALYRWREDDLGFTLIELIVVIAVLGVLATLLIPRVVGVRKDAEDKVDEINKKMIESALERYYADHNEYPTASQGLDGLTLKPKNEGEHGPYLDTIPDGWKNKYEYIDKDNYKWKDTGGGD